MYVVVISIVARLPTKGGVSPPPFSLLLKLCHQIEHELSRPTLRSCALPVSLQSIYGIALYDFTPQLGNIQSVLDFVVFITYMPILYVHFLCTCLQVKGNSMA